MVCALSDADAKDLGISTEAGAEAVADVVADHLVDLLGSGLLVRRRQGWWTRLRRGRPLPEVESAPHAIDLGRTTRPYGGVPLGSTIAYESMGCHLWVTHEDHPEIFWDIWADDQKQVAEWMRMFGLTMPQPNLLPGPCTTTDSRDQSIEDASDDL